VFSIRKLFEPLVVVLIGVIHDTTLFSHPILLNLDSIGLLAGKPEKGRQKIHYEESRTRSIHNSNRVMSKAWRAYRLLIWKIHMKSGQFFAHPLKSN
jgi:hypothetical protein|tara:strand:- start:299 stop:589 length:291 start_codon:yes stop_codon:yes gene_type:complete